MARQLLKVQLSSIFREKRVFFLLLFSGTLTEYLYLTVSGWVPLLRRVIFGLPLVIFLIILLIALFITSIIYLVSQIIEHGISLKAFFLLITLVVTIALVWFLPIPPSRVEMTFYRHHEEFKKLTELAIKQYRETGEFDFPSWDFYEFADIYDYDGFINDGGLARRPKPNYSIQPQKIVVEYIINDFYRPLVFVASDNPDEVYDNCSCGGVVIKKIEPHWYICERDWN